MKRPPTTRLLALLTILLALGCGELGPLPPPGPYRVVIENQSQFELMELRLHATPEYRDAPSLLEAPLAPGAETSTVTEGHLYFTAIRARARGARPIALTSLEPLWIRDAGWFELIVFDESFRLLPH